MSDSATNIAHEVSTPSQMADSKSRNCFTVEQNSYVDTSETKYHPIHTQDTPVASKVVKHTVRWLHRLLRLLRGHGLGHQFRLRGPKNSSPQARGWRKTILIAATATGIVLLTNIILTIVAVIKFPTDSDGIGLIYRGGCDRVKRWDITLHLLINLLSTILLAASSFTMQCLSSPTRSEVNAAHIKRKSLEIGVASFTNLFYVSRWKAIIWLLSCLSTVPLHLFWNSTVLTTVPQNYFSIVMADQAFLQGATYSQVNDSMVSTCYNAFHPCNNDKFECNNTLPTEVIGSIYKSYTSGQYLKMTAAECLDVYTDALPDTRRNLIILVQQPTASARMVNCGFSGYHKDKKQHDMLSKDDPVMWNGSSVVGVAMNVSTDVLTKKLWGYNIWISRFENPQIPSLNYLETEVKSTGTWPLGDYRVEACYSENIMAMPCDLQFLPSMLYIVVACNVVKFACICITARYLWNLEDPILATVGDAVSSYLQCPDQTTRGLCLVDYRDCNRGVSLSYNPIYSRRPKRRLYFAATCFRWWVSVIFCISYLLIGWFLWSIPLGLWQKAMTFELSMQLSFGGFNSLSTVTLEDLYGNLFGNILVANAFQVALSISYFLYNSLWTVQCGALEWASYIQGEKRTLRVTHPSGQQRSTYYLQLPYRYGIPLIMFLMAMHFLVSQSVFLVRIRRYYLVGHDIHDGTITELGYSSRAIFTTCIVGSILILIQIAHACRPFDNRIPTHGNNSTVLSAMCHPGRCDQDELESCGLPSDGAVLPDIASGPIMWGVTRYPNDSVDGSSMGIDQSNDNAGHCSFSADMVELPEIGKKYR